MSTTVHSVGCLCAASVYFIMAGNLAMLRATNQLPHAVPVRAYGTVLYGTTCYNHPSLHPQARAALLNITVLSVLACFCTYGWVEGGSCLPDWGKMVPKGRCKAPLLCAIVSFVVGGLLCIFFAPQVSSDGVGRAGQSRAMGWVVWGWVVLEPVSGSNWRASATLAPNLT